MAGDLLLAVGRLVHIAVVLVVCVAGGGGAALAARSWGPLARVLCRGFEHLGPAFVKLGQFLSVRPDLVPASALAEFERLQDQARPIPFPSVVKVLERELLSPPLLLFPYLDPVPLASASLSQVHRARLDDGSEVVVKVRRPGIASVLRRDFRLVTALARWVLPLTPLRRRLDPNDLTEELEQMVDQELDFRVEGERAEAFRRNFRNFPGLRIPRVHWRYTGRRVLTTEFVQGTKISSLGARQREDFRELAELGAAAFLQQVLVAGLFHADLHPANLLITPAGEIAYLDFGIVGSLSNAERSAIRGVLSGLLARDVSLALHHLTNMGVRVPEERAAAFATEMERVVDMAMAPSLEQISVARIARGILAAVRRHRVFLPRRQALLVKALLTVEGSARLLHPAFSFEAAARKYLFSRARKELSWNRIAEGACRAGAWMGLAALIASQPRAGPHLTQTSP